MSLNEDVNSDLSRNVEPSSDASQNYDNATIPVATTKKVIFALDNIDENEPVSDYESGTDDEDNLAVNSVCNIIDKVLENNDVSEVVNYVPDVLNNVNNVNLSLIDNDVNNTIECLNNIKVRSDDLPSSSKLEKLESVESLESPSGTGFEELLDTFDSGGRRKRHIFILSSAGKPVYTRYGSEDKLVTLFGVMQALVSVVQDSDDSLQAICSGRTCIAFMSEGPIILVGVSHNNNLAYLRRKLKYIHNQVVSILTLTQLTKIFEERHNYDLRRLLTGSERIIDHLLTFTESKPEFMFDSISCLQMPQSARDAISNTIASCCSKIKNLVFGILIGNDRVVSIVSLKKYKLEPCDIHLICNLISSSESFKTAESWTPICLPNFNPSGYLHAHVSYFDDCEACLLLLTVEKDSFFELSEAKSRIEEKLVQNQSMIILKSALSQKSFPSVKQMEVASYVRHFIYKSCTNSQLFYSEIIEPYETQEKWEDLLSKYHDLYSCMINPTQPLKVLYQQLSNEVMLGWVTKKFELYAVFEPLVQKSDCINMIDKILQWTQKEEEKLFMANYYYFN